MQSLLNFVCILFIFPFLQAQNYSVSTYQKINDLNGGFNGLLDVQDNLGVSIDNIGDLDGNGVNDLVVGAFSDDDGGNNRGAVWILFLDALDMVISQTKISDTSGGFTGVLDDDDRFGGGVAYLGDLNKDGLIEIAVAADYDGDGGFWHGAVYILTLNIDGTVNSHAKISDTQGGFTGVINGGGIFGSDIENIGDLNGDGIDDIAVGSRRDSDGGANRGALWILFMNNDFTVNSSQKISSTSGNFSGSLQFEDFFGGSVANVGDLDNDGVVDLVVGSYRENDGAANAGSFYVLFMNIDGTVKNQQKVSNTVGGFSSEISSGALFGESIDGVIDIDGDGKVEIVVGAMKQNNPALNSDTGGFFIIELNNDGTVSEEYFYSYAENCFSGLLQSGDLFGGAVTVLSNVSGDITIAVGAYRDSENGTNKGAVWILNLGEVVFNLEDPIHPTSCGTSDGSILISNLNLVSNYQVNYTFNSILYTQNLISDNGGEISIDGLSGGTYENINVTEVNSGCSDDLGNISLEFSSLLFSITGVDSSSCSVNDGSIIISNANVGSSYIVNYELDMQIISDTFIANSSGEIVISGLYSNSYENITVTNDASNCIVNLGEVILNTTNNQFLLTVSQPQRCDINDGSILISNLVAASEYSINYTFNSISSSQNYLSNANGEIMITALSTGNYNSVVVVETNSGCSDNLGQFVLEPASLTPSASVKNPSMCGVNDGSITISNVISGSTYIVNYELDSQIISETFIANSSSEITISALYANSYENITLTNVASSCTINMGEIVLYTTNEEYFLSVSHPTGCDIKDGFFSVSSLESTTEFLVSYNFASQQVETYFFTDVHGDLYVTELEAGAYENIVITDIINGCVNYIENVYLESNLLSARLEKTNASFCDASDGSISFLGADMNSDYLVSYVYSSEVVSLEFSSNSFGRIDVLELEPGSYVNINLKQLNTGCILEFEDVDLSCQTRENNCFTTENFFTPNGDGINDYWYLKPINEGCNYNLYIHNRKGKMLANLNSENPKWDGTYQGVQMPSTDYWYIVEYVEGQENKIYKSHFSLKR